MAKNSFRFTVKSVYVLALVLRLLCGFGSVARVICYNEPTCSFSHNRDSQISLDFISCHSYHSDVQLLQVC